MATAMREDVDFHGLRLTSPDKVLYPEQAITKLALAEYYAAVADRMLPHLLDRPVTLVRCPTGRQKKCFYQRHVGSGVPDALGTVEISGFEDSGAYLYVKDRQGLIALVQMGVLEIHPWGARVDAPERPDRIVFDLDPGEGLGFAEVVDGAHELRRLLDALGLESFPKTTGGKGLHLVVPVARRHSWAEVKGFARAVAEAMSASAPDRFLAQMSKAARRGRIFIDYLRNDPTSTAIAPYSTRARAGAPVAFPLSWRDVTRRLDPSAFTLKTVPSRLRRQRADPWDGIAETRQTLPSDLLRALGEPAQPARRRLTPAD